MTEPRAPFDPGDPFEAMADSFRVQVVGMLLVAGEAAIFRNLPPHRQIECYVAGVLTGLVGACFASIYPDGRDDLSKFIADYLPQARMTVEEMSGARHD